MIFSPTVRPLTVILNNHKEFVCVEATCLPLMIIFTLLVPLEVPLIVTESVDKVIFDEGSVMVILIFCKPPLCISTSSTTKVLVVIFPPVREEIVTFFLSPIFIVLTASSTSVKVFSLSPTVKVVATLFIFTETLSPVVGGVVRAASPLTVMPGAGGVVVVAGGGVVVPGVVGVFPVPVMVISATIRAVSILPKLSSIFASIVYFPDSVNE